MNEHTALGGSGKKEATAVEKNITREAVNEEEQIAARDGVKAGDGGSKTSGVGNPVDIAGKGSTGRTVPNNINEQMSMHQVQSNPLDNATELPFKLKDERWLASDGWVKMQSIVENSDETKSTIHFVYNKIAGAFDDFKFKSQTSHIDFSYAP